MADTVKRQLLRQFDTAWKLTSYHLDGLTTAECLWHPAGRGPHVRETPGSRWQADWPAREDYAMGPPSIGWLTWHIQFWWSMALDHSFGAGTLSREGISWPGDADHACASIRQLQHEWLGALSAVDDDDLGSPQRTRWPLSRGRSATSSPGSISSSRRTRPRLAMHDSCLLQRAERGLESPGV